MSQHVFITGCSRGIGQALARHFSRQGWTVFASARNPASLDAFKGDPNISALVVDVLDQMAVENAARTVAASSASLDLLINNAAIFPGEGNERLEAADLAWFNEAFATNVVGVARVTRAFLPLLRQSASARIANISSGAASISSKEDFAYYPYAVSKAALNMLTRAMAAEFQPDGITTVAISPGWVKTAMGGPNAEITPEESAASLYRTLTTLTPSAAGAFLGRDGRPYAW